MPRRKSKRTSQPPGPENRSFKNVLQETLLCDVNREPNQETSCGPSKVDGIDVVGSLLNDENCPPSSSSTFNMNELSSDTAALYDELDSFRQRWKRELEVTKNPCAKIENQSSSQKSVDDGPSVDSLTDLELTNDLTNKNSTDLVYSKAKRLFLIAVEMEENEMHYESIRYYKQAMRLCPDIEKRIFAEQCEETAKAAKEQKQLVEKSQLGTTSNPDLENIGDQISLEERIRQNYQNDPENERFIHCRPRFKPKTGTVHISDLPHELILQIYRYVIGGELDLASLESMGMVCRSFYLLSRSPSLWRSICYSTWGEIPSIVTSPAGDSICNKENEIARQPVDWRQVYLEKPRVNYDGVYISRTRYVRQGDVGFQDITYRPFHVVQYYRYLRFFPDRRVLILTTNEEPDKIVPIFRHALHAKQFSTELSILEGTYSFSLANRLDIEAEKDCRASQISAPNQRRQAEFHWSRQTPLSQKFNLSFELKTAENRPFRNNVLKWLDYAISTELETGRSLTHFDLTQDTFPNLYFSRVKRFNLKLTNALTSH